MSLWKCLNKNKIFEKIKNHVLLRIVKNHIKKNAAIILLTEFNKWNLILQLLLNRNMFEV